jgi:uncharacterized protein
MDEEEADQARALINTLGLQPHPEGGYFRETYRSKEGATGLPERYKGSRVFSTAILFLLPAGSKSRLHRLKSDELWHFHLGGPLKVVEISPEGKLTETLMGPELGQGQVFQHAVPAGSWFGAEPVEGTAFSLVGCTVAPGFDFADFEMGERGALARLFPKAEAAIKRLTD